MTPINSSMCQKPVAGYTLNDQTIGARNNRLPAYQNQGAPMQLPKTEVNYLQTLAHNGQERKFIDSKIYNDVKPNGSIFISFDNGVVPPADPAAPAPSPDAAAPSPIGGAVLKFDEKTGVLQGAYHTVMTHNEDCSVYTLQDEPIAPKEALKLYNEFKAKADPKKSNVSNAGDPMNDLGVHEYGYN